MIKAAVSVNPEGKISKVFLGASEELIEANTSVDDVVLFIDPPEDRSDYWDFDSESWIGIGTAPTDHHSFNYSSKVWEDFWALEGYLEQALAKAKLDADKATYSGFSYKGRTIQSDLKSQSAIQSIVVEDTIDWITEDNSTLTLSKEEFDELKLQLSLHLQTVRAHYNELKYSLPTYTLDQLKDFIDA